nr:Cytochrome P450 [Sitophilus oryzae]
MNGPIDLIFGLGLIFIAIYVYFKYSYTYWRKKGFPYLEPKFPLGNNPETGLHGQFNYSIETKIWYQQIKKLGVKFGGVWSFANKVLVLADPEYIKDILVKDFNYFTDRDFYRKPNEPNLENLFLVGHHKWKNQRQKMSPTFTTAKLRLMFDTIVDCADGMVKLGEESSENKQDVVIKDLLEKFTIDVVGCTMFGLNFNCLLSENPKLRDFSKLAGNPPTILKILLLLTRIFPKLSSFLGIKTFPDHLMRFFVELMNDTVSYRKTNKIKRSDLTQTLIDLEETTRNDPNPFSYGDLTANLIGFFFAGSDTSSRTIQFTLYYLAQESDIQDRARKEIHTVLNRHGGKLTYDALNEMTYVNQIIDEALRLFPPLMSLSRICNQDYTFKGTNFTLEKGTPVVISIIGLHHDPDLFPDPEKFDPERFSPENKHKIVPYSYMPFGDGPRICIGRRFGLMQAGIGLVRILKDFKVDISSKTKLPLVIKPGGIFIETTEPLYLKLTKL